MARFLHHQAAVIGPLRDEHRAQLRVADHFVKHLGAGAAPPFSDFALVPKPVDLGERARHRPLRKERPASPVGVGDRVEESVDAL